MKTLCLILIGLMSLTSCIAKHDDRHPAIAGKDGVWVNRLEFRVGSLEGVHTTYEFDGDGNLVSEVMMGVILIYAKDWTADGELYSHCGSMLRNWVWDYSERNTEDLDWLLGINEDSSAIFEETWKLYLVGNPNVQDSHLKVIGTFSQLKEINIRGCQNVSKEAVDSLRKARPDVYVNYD